MARFRRRTNFFKDNYKGFLVGAATGLLVILLVAGSDSYVPALKSLLPWTEKAPRTEVVEPPAEETTPSPEDSGAEEAPRTEAVEPPAEEATPSLNDSGAEENSGFWNWLKTNGLKLWPILFAIIPIIEAGEYLWKFFALIGRFFRRHF